MVKFILSYRPAAHSGMIRSGKVRSGKVRSGGILRCWFLSFAAILLAGRMMAQSDVAGDLHGKFDAYASHSLREKLFVHTDKPAYLAGEICWMKIYSVDGASHRPLDFSKIAYIELLDKDDRFVLQGKVALEGAEGKGSFFLPVTLNSGNYKLRAYTNWMKNFGPDHFFEKAVTIINTLKELPTGAGTTDPPTGAGNKSGSGASGSSDPSTAAGNKSGSGASGSSSASAPGFSGSPPASLPSRYLAAFFPEGGDLLKNIPSKVGFLVTDRYGKGADCQGFLLDERGDTAAVFSPLHAGIGSFLFTPSGDHHYRALLRMPDNDTLIKELPAAREQGYAIRLEETAGRSLKLTVRAHGVSSGNVYLFGQCRSVFRWILRSALAQDSGSFLVDKDSLGEGINQLTLFNAEGRPVCERLYFRRPENALSIGVSSDQPQYGLRKKVNLGINASPSASLSLAVYRIDSLQAPQDMDIYAYWWLGSELKGRIESPDYYLSVTGPAAEQAADNLMLTHGWRRFRWDNVLRNRPASLPFPPEFNGQIIMGKFTDARTGEPLRDRIGFLSVPGARFQFQAAKTDSTGKLFFDIRDYFGPGSIVIQAGTSGDSTCKVEILSPFSEQYTPERLPPFVLSPAQQQSLVDRNIGMQVQNIWSGDSMQKFLAPSLDTLHFFGKPDYSYLLDDYTRFTTMEEVLREYVREVNVNHLHGKLHVLMLNEPHHEFFEDENTLILLDGVPVSDRIFSYDPLKVKKLEVIPRMYFQGPASFSGIASFTTYKGDYEGMELDARSVLLDYEGLQWQREFYSPEYATDSLAASRLPDFRNLLFWSPDLHIFGEGKKQCEFYTSDLPGKYLVVVQGVTAGGNAGSATMSFEVK